MKKYFLVVLLILFIAPSVALASWWNPLSWFNGWTFNRKEVVPQVQVETQKTPEEKISELQKQIDDLKKQEPKASVIPKTPVVEKKIAPKISVPTLVEPTPVPVLDYSKYTNPITGKIYTPQEYADAMAQKALNEARSKALKDNPDPYGVLYGTGIQYTPEQLDAIDCAYYGRNCPTIYIAPKN